MAEFFGRPRESRLGEILAQMEQRKYDAIAQGISQASGALGGAIGRRGEINRQQEQGRQSLREALLSRGMLGTEPMTGTVAGGQKVWDQGVPLSQAFPEAGFSPSAPGYLRKAPEDSMSALEVLKTGRFQPKSGVEIPASERITAQNFSKYFELVPQTFVDEKGRVVTTAPHGAKALGDDYKKRSLEIKEEELGLKKEAATDKKQKESERIINARESATKHATDVTTAAKNALGLIGPFTTGITGKVASNIPGTDRKSLEGYIDTLKANLSFEQLQEMRNNAKTGGALGQVSDYENRMLAATVAALDPDQDPKVLKANIEKVQKQYQAIIDKLNAPPKDGGAAMERMAKGPGDKVAVPYISTDGGKTWRRKTK